MTKRHLKLVTPTTVNRTVTPKRLPNADLRTREYLTESEVERLTNAARKNRWGHRDATMVLVAYRHGLRASELVDLRAMASARKREDGSDYECRWYGPRCRYDGPWTDIGAPSDQSRSRWPLHIATPTYQE